MGTPFRGAQGGLADGGVLKVAQDQLNTLENEQDRYEAQIISRILEVLTPGNEALLNLLTEFLDIPADLLPQMVCFYETQPSRVWKIVGLNKNKVNGRFRPLYPLEHVIF